MKWIGTFFFYIFVLLISIMPFCVMYLFSDFLYLLMRYVVGYRKKVILSNLKRAFPDKSDKEINRLRNIATRNLTDSIVEGLKTFTMSKKQIVRRHKLLNPEILSSYFAQGSSVIGVTAHYNNWEWGSLSASLQVPFKVAALYKPLSNKHLDKVLRLSRSRCGTELVSIYETSKMFERYQGQPTVFLMAADQSPSARELPKAFWVDFLGINTPFLHGMEKHARSNNLPVLFIDIKRVKRGFYTLELSLLTDEPELLAEGELTRRYAAKLEKIISGKPEYWLWSHKRWKHCK